MSPSICNDSAASDGDRVEDRKFPSVIDRLSDRERIAGRALARVAHVEDITIKAECVGQHPEINGEIARAKSEITWTIDLKIVAGAVEECRAAEFCEALIVPRIAPGADAVPITRRIEECLRAV